jgi:hypothetical protein
VGEPTVEVVEVKSKRSWEFGAIPIVLVVLGVLAIIMTAFTAGLWAWVAVGGFIAIALVLLMLWAMARPEHPTEPLAGPRPQAAAPPDEAGAHRVLVIADESCSARDLGAAIASRRNGTRVAAFVVAPVLGSRTARWTGDEHAYARAAEHLDATLQALAELHVEAAGHVGSHDPLQAADDGLREFSADEIVFAVHPAASENWLEHGVVDAARARYPVPVKGLELEPSS